MLDSHEEALIAIKTIEVGVDTFSFTLDIDEMHILLSFHQVHLNKRERTEKEQMSTPLPATALKTPPT